MFQLTSTDELKTADDLVSIASFPKLPLSSLLPKVFPYTTALCHCHFTAHNPSCFRPASNRSLCLLLDTVTKSASLVPVTVEYDCEEHETDD